MEQPGSSVETLAPPPGILVAGYFAETGDYHVRRAAGTRDWLITYTVGGRGQFRFGRSVHVCGAGDIVVLTPGVPHDYATSLTAPTWRFYWAHFIPRPRWAGWLRLPEIQPGVYALSIRSGAVRRRLERAFTRLVQDTHGLGALRDELAQNALEEALILVAQDYAAGNARAPVDPRVDAVLQRLSQEFHKPLVVEELAAAVALSPSRLAHLFKQQVGDSIMATLLKLRLRQAARLLEFTSRQVGEIAWDVGFQSPFHFSRQFKAYYGMSPTEYRELLWRTEDREQS